MSATLTQTLMSEFGLDDLTAEARKQLAHELIDSLGDTTPADDAAFSDEWRAEIKRRIENARKHPELGKAWETVESELRGRLKCTN